MESRCVKRGFTLMEMLIVVAIIAILVAIAIPVFSAQLEKAREATCTANRRSLQGVVIADFLLGDEKGEAYKDTNAAFADAFTGDEYAQKNYICPDKGVFSWKQVNDQMGYVTCSKHGTKTGAGAMQALAEEIKLRDQSKLFTDVLEKYLDIKDGKGNPTDKSMDFPLPESTYFAGWTKELVTEAAKLGIKLDEGSWRVQRWASGNYSIFQYDGDVTQCTEGENINVTKWFVTTDGQLTSQTGTVKAVERTYTEGGTKKPYMGLGTDFTANP